MSSCRFPRGLTLNSHHHYPKAQQTSKHPIQITKKLLIFTAYSCYDIMTKIYILNKFLKKVLMIWTLIIDVDFVKVIGFYQLTV